MTDLLSWQRFMADPAGRALSLPGAEAAAAAAAGVVMSARETAGRAHAVVLGALGLPTVADLERLARRLRSTGQRLDALERSIDRLEAPAARPDAA
jgi:hypothetical protein